MPASTLKKIMRNVFFTSPMTGGAAFYRCYQPAKALTRYSDTHDGICDIDPARRERCHRQELLLRAPVAVIHRPKDPAFIRFMVGLKMKGKKIIFDNDDTFKVDEENDKFGMWEEEAREMGKRFERVLAQWESMIDKAMEVADVVTASTDYLASEYRKRTDHFKVRVRPNYIDTDIWPEPEPNKTDEIRIGLSGSTTRLENSRTIKGVLDEIAERKDVKFVIQGFQSDELLDKNPRLKTYVLPHKYFWNDYPDVEFVDYVYPFFYPTAMKNMKMDMMLIPRKDNVFNKAKSNIKFLEAGMLEIPVIAQRFLDGKSPYEKDIDGSNGILVNNDEEWVEAIEDLIEHKEKRVEMGKNARKYVEDNYSIKDHYDEFEY